MSVESSDSYGIAAGGEDFCFGVAIETGAACSGTGIGFGVSDSNGLGSRPLELIKLSTSLKMDYACYQ